ncbi:MAG: flippase-like domain-containing protein [Deltaproteobacteria bacterium]|nr:flippase-like domain-containing protein [Deltaproteobacteria bacterium]
MVTINPSLMLRTYGRRMISLVSLVVLTGGIFYFMIKGIVQEWSTLSCYSWSVDWCALIFSLVLSVLALGLGIKAAHELCCSLGGRVAFHRFAYIFSLSQLGRYLPGRLWHMVGFAVLLQREQVKPSVSLLLPFIYQGAVIGVFISIGIALCGPAAAEMLFPTAAWLAYLFAIVPIIVILLLPFLFSLVKRFGKAKIGYLRIGSLRKRRYYQAIGFILLSGLGFAASLEIFAFSLFEEVMNHAFYVGGSFLVAYVAGWLVFVTPGGLGVREGVLASMLSVWIPSGFSNIIAIGDRCLMTVAEIVLLVGIVVMSRWRGKKNTIYTMMRKRG